MTDKLRELAERWKSLIPNHPEDSDIAWMLKHGSAELLAILDADGDGGAVAWRETILSVLSALDVATGDSDPNIDPDMTDDDIRDEYPEVWAMQQLSGLLAAPQPPVEPRAVLDGWRPIETAPAGKKIIAGYWNKLGKWRSVMATYYLPGTLELADDADDTDDGYADEGWYEECETSEWIKLTDEPPTHWMPLADAPQVAGKHDSIGEKVATGNADHRAM